MPGVYRISLSPLSRKSGADVLLNVPIPKKYQDPETSGVTFMVEARDNAMPTLVLR